jgi:LmbE family N-acetylglucosaminyl deacetylase
VGFADGSLMSHEAAIASRLAEELRTFRPAQVLCPFPADGHADHQATAAAWPSPEARRLARRCWQVGRRSGRTWRSTLAPSPSSYA